MANALKEKNAVEAAKLLLPRASFLEVTELANELDVVASYIYPGARGWEDLEPLEKAHV